MVLFAATFTSFLLRFGILEKKKDFQKRAKHLHNKKHYIDALKQKAFLRNPDEFTYGMIRASSNSAGQIDLGVEKRVNPNAIKARPDTETRQRTREPRTDCKGMVHKFRFQRKR